MLHIYDVTSALQIHKQRDPAFAGWLPDNVWHSICACFQGWESLRGNECWWFITQITACQLQIMFGSETKDSQSSQSSCREQEAWTNAENSEQTGCRAHISENKQTKKLCRCWTKHFDPFVTKQNKQYIDTNTCITEVVVICVSIYMIGTLSTSHSMTLYGGSGVWAEQLQTFSVFNSDQFNEKLHLHLIYIFKPQSK